MAIVNDRSEHDRVKELTRLEVLDSPNNPTIDQATVRISELIGVPIVAVSLIDKDRQWFKSRIGLTLTETARSIAFCDHTIRELQPMVVEDATRDIRFFNNPLVVNAPGIRFYAGAQLTTQAGVNIGTLCAIDNKPRTISAGDLSIIVATAREVMALLEIECLQSEVRMLKTWFERVLKEFNSGVVVEGRKSVTRFANGPFFDERNLTGRGGVSLGRLFAKLAIQSRSLAPLDFYVKIRGLADELASKLDASHVDLDDLDLTIQVLESDGEPTSGSRLWLVTPKSDDQA